jgi:enoyl-[acyl-carrier protein] reductase II
MKELVPVRLLHNKFYNDILEIENSPLPLAEKIVQLQNKLGRGRAKRGMLDGDIVEGELEIGQIAGLLTDVPTVEQLFVNLKTEFQQTITRLNSSL